MNIYVYSDESGVFDKVHNEWFVFGGLIFLSKEDRDNVERKYRYAEKCLREKYPDNKELKATILGNKEKAKLFRSLNQCFKFGVSIHQPEILEQIYKHKAIPHNEVCLKIRHPQLIK